MNYQEKAFPIRSHAEYVAAKTAGAYMQYTAHKGDTYDVPLYGPNSGGWVRNGDWPSVSSQWPLLPSEKIRAFYPTDVELPEVELPEVEESEETHFGIGLSTALVLGLGALAATVVFGAALVAVVIA